MAEIYLLTRSNSPEESARLGELLLEFEKQKKRYESFGVGYYVLPFERLNND